jgi:adenylate cyclase 9
MPPLKLSPHPKVKESEEQKELANWLIEVVLPSHVMNHIKLKRQYSKNYDCVGVLFLSLCNFGEFFEETYEGGRNLLRVLNEISVDFDRLFDEPQYASVEKIKSIGIIMLFSWPNLEITVRRKDEKLCVY